jgi:hypothetical protein
MIRLIFAVPLMIHGLIHLMGFSKEWNLGPPSMLKHKTTIPLTTVAAKTAGLVWLFACCLLMGTAALYLVQKDWYWMVGIAGVALSQVLIIVYWRDAKYATILNMIILVILMVAGAQSNFDKVVEGEVSKMLHTSALVSPAATAARRTDLPDVVQKWLTASGAFDRPVSAIRMSQSGAMRATAEGKWLDFQATQFCTIDPPAFSWKARISAAPLIFVAGRDKYENGKGQMLIKPMAIYPMANATGYEIDQGTLLRFMGEMIWYPEAAAMDYIRWEEVAPNQAMATMTYKGVTATGTFTFHPNGLPKRFSAERYGDFQGEFRKETWQVDVTGYKKMSNREIPSACEVTWKLRSGDFMWFKQEITRIEYITTSN